MFVGRMSRKPRWAGIARCNKNLERREHWTRREADGYLGHHDDPQPGDSVMVLDGTFCLNQKNSCWASISWNATVSAMPSNRPRNCRRAWRPTRCGRSTGVAAHWPSSRLPNGVANLNTSNSSFAAHLAMARPKVVAALTRQFRSLDGAEEAFQEACVRALVKWPEQGVPRDPTGWLLMTGRNATIDRMRKDKRLVFDDRVEGCEELLGDVELELPNSWICRNCATPCCA